MRFSNTELTGLRHVLSWPYCVGLPPRASHALGSRPSFSYGDFSPDQRSGEVWTPEFNRRPQLSPVSHRICSDNFSGLGLPGAVSGDTGFLEAMAKKTNPGQILLFPSPAIEANGTSGVVRANPFNVVAPSPTTPLLTPAVVLSGSYRKDYLGLKLIYEELRDLNCKVLSPSNVTAVSEQDGFVYMDGETGQTPEAIESRHLDAIQRSNFMWLHAPAGYVGTSAALEIGFAHAIGVPVFAKELPIDPILRSMVTIVPSPQTVLGDLAHQRFPIPRPALVAFQHYYRRVAIQRGYHSEGAKECLLLMVEEVGELAREIRKSEGLVRHGGATSSSESRELADVFLYVVHMANVLDVDLSRIVQDKELSNRQRSLAK